MRRYAHHVAAPLDIGVMQQASDLLIGSQDFGSFGKPTQGESTTREVMGAEWSAIDYQLVFQITANAFLYRMVRKVVGTLIIQESISLLLSIFSFIVNSSFT